MNADQKSEGRPICEFLRYIHIIGELHRECARFGGIYYYTQLPAHFARLPFVI
jgi:hypothetical protein